MCTIVARKSYAPPVTNFSVSCDPVTLEWLTEYAYKKKTTRSKVIREALVDFRKKLEERSGDVNGPIINPEERCCICGSAVLRNFGLVLCMQGSSHRLEATGPRTHQEKPPKKVENPIDE